MLDQLQDDYSKLDFRVRGLETGMTDVEMLQDDYAALSSRVDVLESTGLVHLGAFRILQDSTSPKYNNRETYLATHPDSGKLYVAVSGKIPTDMAGFVGVLDIPDMSGAISGQPIAETPIANQVSGWVEVLTDYIAQGYNPGSSRIGGIAFDGTDLWINFARYYHTQGERTPGVAKFDSLTIERMSDYLIETGGAGSEASDPNGALTSTKGTPLERFGEFMVDAYWMDNAYGPRSSLLKVETNHTTLTPVVYHESDTVHPNASLKCPSGSGCFIGDNYVIPMRNGVAGWYGMPDGTHNGEYEAQPENWVPDEWDKNKGYHAPPYKAELWSVPVAQMVEVLEGSRLSHDCDYMITDITNKLYLSRIDSEGRTQYRSDISYSLVQQGGRFYLLEHQADTTQNTYTPGHMIHVFEAR
jgi:hypothetical protein